MIYTKQDILKSLTGKQYYKNKIYPEIPYSEEDTYIITTAGDRLDTLSNMFYKDIKYWKIINIVNNNITKGSIWCAPGTQLRIPSDVNAIILLFLSLNSSR